MTVRPLRDADIPILREYVEKSGWPYPALDHPHIETIEVVVDSEDRPILAVIGKKMVEVYGVFNPDAGADLRSEAISAVQAPMIEELKSLGYECAEAFTPPQLERRGLGRILMNRFGWYRNWPSYGKRF